MALRRIFGPKRGEVTGGLRKLHIMRYFITYRTTGFLDRVLYTYTIVRTL
jgi:hypothetical protein